MRRRGSTGEEVSEDKVTYPLDEEGGQPELLRRQKKRKNMLQSSVGWLDYRVSSQRRESRNKVGDAAERNKIGKI